MSKARLRLIVFLVLVVFVGVVIFFWQNPKLLVDEFRTLRSRFTLSQKYINAYGIRLFGNDIVIGSRVNIPGYVNTYGYLDNGIARILVELGIVFFIVFFFLYLKSIWKMVAARNTSLIVISLLFLVYAFMEYNPLMVAYNIFLIQNLKLQYDRTSDRGMNRMTHHQKMIIKGIQNG